MPVNTNRPARAVVRLRNLTSGVAGTYAIWRDSSSRLERIDCCLQHVPARRTGYNDFNKKVGCTLDFPIWMIILSLVEHEAPSASSSVQPKRLLRS